MTVRAFDRDTNLDVMESFLTDGKRKVPVFAVFDGLREVARWIERPGVAEPIVQEVRAKYPPVDSPDRETELQRLRAEMYKRLEAAHVREEALREVRLALARELGSPA